MGTIEHVTANSLKEILETEKKPIILDAWASWCGPCKSIEPYFEELNKEFGSRMRFMKINMDEESEIAPLYNISSLPTFIIFKEGKPESSLIGANRAKLKALIEETLK